MTDHWPTRLRDLASAIDASGMQNMFVNADLLRDIASHIDGVEKKLSHWRQTSKQFERQIQGFIKEVVDE